MGREVRRVPLDWQHPKNRSDHYVPLFDWAYTYKIDFGTDPEVGEVRPVERVSFDSFAAFSAFHVATWPEEGTPDPTAYMLTDVPMSERVGYQFYETVTEGTPVSPIMPDPESMVAWLVEEYGLALEDAIYCVRDDGSLPSFVLTYKETPDDRR